MKKPGLKKTFHNPSFGSLQEKWGVFLIGVYSTGIKSVRCVCHASALNFIQIFSECRNIVMKLMLARPDRLYFSFSQTVLPIPLIQKGWIVRPIKSDVTSQKKKKNAKRPP
jgi:hypothetical protein